MAPLRFPPPPVSVRWGVFWVGAVLTLTLGLSAHVLMMTVLHVPYPSGQPRFTVLRFMNDVAIALGVLVLYELTTLRTARLNPAVKVVLLFLLTTMMAEILLRNPLMNGFVTTAWLYAFIGNVPVLAPWLALAALTVAAAPLATTGWRRLLLSVALAAAAFLAFAPLVDRLYAPVLAAAAPLQHDAVYGFPYGWQVTTAAYVTYVEPVGACLLAAALVWPRLGPPQGRRIAAMTLLVVAVRGSLLRPFAYAAFHSDRWWAAFVSDGQFALESVVLGLLTALTWRFAAVYSDAAGRDVAELSD